jgi:hypothetical protein
MASVELKSVTVPAHVEWFVNTGGPQGEDEIRIEVYTGNVIVQFSGADTTKRETFFTYLPMGIDPGDDPGDGSFLVRQYGKAPDTVLTVSAIIVTPVGVSLTENDTTFSVDDWGLQPKPQSFPGIAGHPNCLILNFDLAVRNGVIIRVGYQVTVTTPRNTPNIDTLSLKPSHAPQ